MVAVSRDAKGVAEPSGSLPQEMPNFTKGCKRLEVIPHLEHGASFGPAKTEHEHTSLCYTQSYIVNFV